MLVRGFFYAVMILVVFNYLVKLTCISCLGMVIARIYC